MRPSDCPNYTEAWNLLKSRYKVMRVIVEAHLRAIVEVKKATDDTADAVRSVLNVFNQHIRELKALGRPVEFWDDWLVHEIVTKLALETRKQWELSLVTDEPPTLEQLTTFLEVRCRSLEMLTPSISQVVDNPTKSTKVFHVISEQANTRCMYCNGLHKIYSCEKFRVLDSTAKSMFIQESKGCFNCLSPGHYKNRCNSTSACQICHQRHHTLLHGTGASSASNTPAHFEAYRTAPNTPPCSAHTIESSGPASPVTSSPTNTAAKSVSSCLTSESNPLFPMQKTVLLSTALVRVRDCSDRWQTARLLFDSGSHATFITEGCIQRLGLPRTSSAVFVTGIGSSQGGRCRGETSLLLSPSFSDDPYPLDALILPEITNDLPSQALDIPEWPHIRGLLLADPHFKEPGRVDILIGMDVMCNLMCTELRKGPPGTPMAQKTVFGWTLCGSVDSSAPPTPKVQSLHCEVQFDRALIRIEELEESPLKLHLTQEERFRETFTSTQRKISDCRFLVELPLKVDVPWGGPRDRDNGFLLRFRTHHIAVTADVVMMYRQISVSPKYVGLHHIVWRSHLSLHIKNYRKLHITYRVAAAMYLTAKALQQTAKAADVVHDALAMLFKNAPSSRLIISDTQYFTVHAGPCIMQVLLQRRLWVFGDLSLMHIYYKCIKCTCLNRSASTNSMSDFPASRTYLQHIVSRRAVDFTNRYSYKFVGRGAKSAKREICSVICFASGAPNPEVVGNLSAPACLNALKLFINRRGYCETTFCDNGTSFVRDEKELRIMGDQCITDDALQAFFTEFHIEWYLNPLTASHLVGYWETGIHRITCHLNHILGKSLLSYEKVGSLLTIMEAYVNSRTLREVSAPAINLEAVTPEHFIIGKQLKAILEPEGQGFHGNINQLWQSTSKIRLKICRRCLQRRTKWFSSSRNHERDMVIVLNEATAPTKWTLTRVIGC